MEKTDGSSSVTMASELTEKLDPDLQLLLGRRDGAASLARELPRRYSPEKTIEGSRQCRAWELAGQYYWINKRPHEALPIFMALYYQMLAAQKRGRRIHKGLPLVWIYECHLMMGHAALAKRFLMLTLIEDAIRGKGSISAETGGVYFRLVWRHGLAESELQRYAKLSYELALNGRFDSLFPEWVLQKLDKNWMTEFPTSLEAASYSANPRYVKYLIDKLGDGSGKVLEELADYVLSSMPGCRTVRGSKTPSTQYDIVCSVEGSEVDFRSELGRYFVCECKDWNSAANFDTLAKFCRVLDSVKSRFGILFSRKGISGKGKARYAELEQLKVFQDRGIVIVVIDQEDLERVAQGGNFINLLREKYQKVRLNLLGP